MVLGGQTTEFQMYTHCVVQHGFWFSDRSLTSQATPFADEVWKNKKLLEDWDELFRTVCSHLASFSMSAVHLGAMRERSLSNGTILETPGKPL